MQELPERTHAIHATPPGGAPLEIEAARNPPPNPASTPHPTRTRTRQVDVSVTGHMQELPDLTHAVKFTGVSHATKESLTATWAQWV